MIIFLVDMIVQYKLFGPIMPECICTSEDKIVAKMETEVNRLTVTQTPVKTKTSIWTFLEN